MNKTRAAVWRFISETAAFILDAGIRSVPAKEEAADQSCGGAVTIAVSGWMNVTDIFFFFTA